MQFHVKLRKLYARICSRVRKKVTKSHVLFYIFKLVFSLCIYGRLVLLTFCYCVYSLPLPRCVFLLYRRIMLQSLCATHSLSELYEESKTSRFVNFSLNDKNSNSLYRQRVRIFVVALQCMIQSCLRRGRHKFYNFFYCNATLWSVQTARGTSCSDTWVFTIPKARKALFLCSYYYAQKHRFYAGASLYPKSKINSCGQNSRY